MLTAFALVLSLLTGSLAVDDQLLTVAETSDFQATATYEQVIDLVERIAKSSPVAQLTELSQTVKDRAIPLLVIADPPVKSAEEARASGKPIVFAFGNIHAGEVCGKEALLMLARELATTPEHPLLEDIIVLLAPIYNADGNQPMSPDNRPGQVGPVQGMGQRPNAQGLDLNRDWIKLEAPETRAMVRLFNEWDPTVTIDTHTTNGSYHRYALTFAAPLNPSGYAPAIEMVRDELLPTVSERLRERTGYDSFFYGNFNRDQTVWATYSAQPRFGGPYRGLRGQMSILSEAHAYASYEDRVLVTREFVREIMQYVAENAVSMVIMQQRARLETSQAGENPQPNDVVGLRHRLATFARPVVIRGYEMTRPERGRPRPTEVEKDYSVIHLGRFEPTVSVRRPFAYILKPGMDDVLEKLRQHGIRVEPFQGKAKVEAYTVQRIDRAERSFQGRNLATFEVIAEDVLGTFAEGSMIVRTAQPLGTLAVYLLEPESEDGLATWGFFDSYTGVDKKYPVARVRCRLDID